MEVYFHCDKERKRKLIVKKGFRLIVQDRSRRKTESKINAIVRVEWRYGDGSEDECVAEFSWVKGGAERIEKNDDEGKDEEEGEVDGEGNGVGGKG